MKTSRSLPNIAMSYPGTAAIIFIVMGLLTRSVYIDLEKIGTALEQRQGGHSIVDFELASPSRAETILTDWSAKSTGGVPGAPENGIDDARASVVRDFAFIPTYSTTAALAVFFAAWLIASAGWSHMAVYATRIAWAQWLAALFDIAENLALLRVLADWGPNGIAAPPPATVPLTQWIAVVAASAKFGLLIAGATTVLLSAAAALAIGWRRLKS